MKKIKLMHYIFGIDNDHKCRECIHMICRNEKNCYQKCDVYGVTHSEASDWAKSYTACGMFNKTYNDIPIIKQRLSVKEEEIIPGQVLFNF